MKAAVAGAVGARCGEANPLWPRRASLEATVASKAMGARARGQSRRCAVGGQGHSVASSRPLLSGWLILYRGGGVGGSEAKKKFVYLKSTSKFGPL